MLTIDLTWPPSFPIVIFGTAIKIDSMMAMLDHPVLLIILIFSFILHCTLVSYILKLKNRLRILQREKIKLKRSADRDGLTGLYNRAAGERLLNKILSRKPGQSFGILLLDLDHFKFINDTFGHLMGDQAIQTMIQKCLPQLRKNDVFIRWGGEEFLIIVRSTNQIDLIALAERLRAEVATIKLRGNITVTTSLGVTISSLTDTADSLIDRADQALYQAKRLGRNQVSFMNPPQPPLASPVSLYGQSDEKSYDKCAHHS